MANVANGNTFYIDTQSATEADDLVLNQVVVTHILVTATGANGRVVLADLGNNPTKKLDLRVATSGETKPFRFEGAPVVFPAGIKALTLTNAVVTVVYRSQGGQK